MINLITIDGSGRKVARPVTAGEREELPGGSRGRQEGEGAAGAIQLQRPAARRGAEGLPPCGVDLRSRHRLPVGRGAGAHQAGAAREEGGDRPSGAVGLSQLRPACGVPPRAWEDDSGESGAPLDAHGDGDGHFDARRAAHPLHRSCHPRQPVLPGRCHLRGAAIARGGRRGIRTPAGARAAGTGRGAAGRQEGQQALPPLEGATRRARCSKFKV